MLDDLIITTLKRELERATQQHQAAKENFWRVAAHPRELPRYTAGKPEPDSGQMIRDAIAEETNALNEHIEALMRLNAYLLNGTIPAHLKEKAKSAGQ